MAEVFADTSGWANFFVHTEPFHTSAKTFMQQRSIIEALTTDHHFEQAGFVRLLK